MSEFYLCRYEVVPGLSSKMVVLEGDLKPHKVACVGDTQQSNNDGKKNRAIINIPAAPKLCKPFQLRVIDLHVLYPRRKELESKIRVSVAKSFTGKDAAECNIVNRFLKFGKQKEYTIFFNVVL